MIKYKLLGLDPGKTTGYCMIHLLEDKYPHVGHQPFESCREDCPGNQPVSRSIYPTLQYGNCKDRELIEIRPLIEEADIICYEGWRTFSKKARSGALDQKEIFAEQAIGSMRTLLRLRTGPQPQIHENLSGLKPVGYGYANMPYKPGMKGKHWQDALCHAVYCAVDKYHWPPVKG